MEDMQNFRHEFDVKCGEIDKKMCVLEERIENTDKLIEQNTEAYKELKKTIQENSSAMQKLLIKMESSEKQIETNSESIKQLKDERNFNVVKWLTSNWITIVLAGYAIYTFVK